MQFHTYLHGSPQHPRRANGLLELCHGPGHVNEGEQQRWRNRKTEKRNGEADEVKVQGHLSPRPLITHTSQRTLKRQEQKKKRN